MSSPANSPQVQLALNFFQANSALDLNLSMSYVTDNFTYQLLPQSLDGQIESKTVFFEGVEQFVPMFKFLDVIVKETFESPGAVVFHSFSSAETNSGEPYTNEYIDIFRFNGGTGDDLKITSLEEFVDSLYTSEFDANQTSSAA